MIYTLLSTARSGSTWYATVLTRKYKARFLNEVFHDENKPQHKSVLMALLKQFSNEDKNCLIKIFPSHAEYSSINNLLEKLINISTETQILVRKDFSSQIKSIYVALEYEKYKNPNSIKNYPSTWQDNFTEPLVINQIDMVQLNTIVDHLKKELILLSELYKKNNFKLLYLEDIKDDFSYLKSDLGKLYRPVVWNEPFPNIEFNTEGLFQ